MQVQMITAEQFERQQQQYSMANFLQSRQMAKLHEQRGVFEQVWYIAWMEEQQVIAQAIVGVRRRFRVFREAILLQGPLFQEKLLAQMPQLVAALERFLKQQKIAYIELNPYLMNRILNEQLEVLEAGHYQTVVDAFTQQGYQRTLDKDNTKVIGQLFRKNLTTFTDVTVLERSLSSSLKRDLRKATESHVIIRELASDELEVFYTILQQTAQRKGFGIQPLSYFSLLKEAFGEQVKFMVAYLDVQQYRAYYESKISEFSQRIDELESDMQVKLSEGKYVKKIKGLITDAKDQLASYQKRKEHFEAWQITEDFLPLSGYLFMCYGDEVISFFGGSHEEYINFGGSSLLHWEMMKYAKENQYSYFNFYGTIETQQAIKNDGNFNFKRQFGGELDELVGNFSKALSPLLRLLLTIKK